MSQSKPVARPDFEKPKASDFDPGAVQSAVLKDTLTHYASLGGWATAFLTAFATLFGLLTPIGWVIAIGGATFAASSFVVNYFLRNETFAKKHVGLLLKKRREYDQLLIKGLREECARADFERGDKEAQELWEAYETLISYLDENASFDDPEATRYRHLADDLYVSGIFNLRKAAGMYRSIAAVDVEGLERELRGYQSKRARAVGDLAAYLDQEITTTKGRIADYTELSQAFLKRLAGANEVEGQLQRAAGKLSELGIGTAASGSIDWTTASRDLQSAVDAAVESDDELRELVAKQ